MKFRAVMKDIQYMREFQNLVTTLTKLSKECVLKISADKLTFIVNEESSSMSPLVWIEINASIYFASFQMMGVSTVYPSILLSMSTVNFSRAFVSVRNNPKFLKMKLTNVQFPCLTIESDSLTPNAMEARSLVHDVPVTVIPSVDWCAYTVPQLPKCTLIVKNMPSNRFMRGLIDKLKNLSPNLVFYATSRGELNLVAETESSTITTSYRKLDVHVCNPNDEDDGGNSSTKSASCSVNCKKTSMFFTALQVPTSDLNCGINNEECIYLKVNVRDGVVIQSILPAICV